MSASSFSRLISRAKTTPLAQGKATALASQPCGNADLRPLIFHLSDTWTGWRWWAGAAPPVQDQTSYLCEHDSRYVTNNYETTGDYRLTDLTRSWQFRPELARALFLVTSWCCLVASLLALVVLLNAMGPYRRCGGRVLLSASLHDAALRLRFNALCSYVVDQLRHGGFGLQSVLKLRLPARVRTAVAVHWSVSFRRLMLLSQRSIRFPTVLTRCCAAFGCRLRGWK